jgi:DNA polymerase-3 subunit alpha
MNDLESMGLIKMDILATSILTVIDRTVKMVKSNYGIDIDIENLSLEDEPTFELYRKGKLKGVFQCENGGMQQTMRDIGVSSFNDVVAAIALYRPGPMGSIPEYCERKKGLTPVSYFHPTIEPFVKPHLKRTYGILTYQEQVMQICNSLAGISVTDGYILIKGIGKKKEHLISQYKVQFIDGCVGNGVPANIAEQYWDTFIIPFASYGFNMCLDGSMRIKNKKTNKFYTIEEMEKRFRDNKNTSIVLDSYRNGEIIEDKLVDVFKTGEKDIYEVELENGTVLKCTLDHKFICKDGKKYSVQEIIDNDLEIICFEEGNKLLL